MLCELALRMENAVQLQFRLIINEVQLLVYAVNILNFGQSECYE